MPRKAAPKRRERGDGGLYQRGDGRWCASADIPPAFPGGPRRRKVFYGATRDEARQKLYAWSSGGAAVMTATTKGTLGAFLAFWLDDVKISLAFHSRRSYRARIDHCAPLHATQLDKLTTAQLQAHIAYLHRTHSAYVAGQVLALLRQALAYAVRIGRLRSNPAINVERPKHTPKAPRPLTIEQALAFTDTIHGHAYEAGFWLSLCGLRTGEVRGACWSDVDWQASTIVVKQAAKNAPGGSELGTTKTKSSMRTVYVFPQALAALASAREHWRQTVMTRRPEARDLIVVSKRGGILHANTYRHAYTVVLKAAGIPHTALHNLRHTYATIASNHGASPRAVQAQLGHARPDQTFGYTHTMPEGQQRAAAVFGEALTRKAE